MSTQTDAVRSGARGLSLFGVMTVGLGVLAMIAPGLAGLSIAIMVGVLIIAAGILRLIWAFRAESLGQGILMFLIGGLTLLCGVALVSSPLLAAGFLTIALTIYLLIDGTCEITAGFRHRPAPGSGWLLFAGSVSIVLGLMVWKQFPLSGPWAIGILLGIKLLFIGMTMIMIGANVRAVTNAVEAPQ